MNPLPPGITNVGYLWLYNRRATQGIDYYTMFTRYGFAVLYSDVGSNRQYFAQDTSSMLDVYGIFGSYDAIVAWITPPPPTEVVLTILETENGATNPATGQYNIVKDTVQSVQATANSGYVLSNWVLDGANAGTDNPIQVTMNANHSLQAVFTSTTPPPNGNGGIPTPPTNLPYLLIAVGIPISLVIAYAIYRQWKK